MPKVTVDPEKCNGDGLCISVCPTNVFDFINNKAVPKRPQDCILCMACVSQCPTQAITVEE
ncbi:MAG: ferredoxin family protein [Candidatus Methanomethylicia archaeon]|jgi:NAD-dependent dihydropyrimidine dehydrogenase PreA subunit|nr:ferredoxin family protein [Candidatus Methanomethylicia archaeon]MCQ5341387.1 ferredoxin family protein [Candidatus Methanomethylicia archaeon]